MRGLNGKRLSPSGVDRALLCAYSFVADQPWADKQGPSAKLGSAFHDYSQDLIDAPWSARTVDRLGDEHKLAPYQRRDLAIMMRKLDDWIREQDFSGAEAEVKLAVDPERMTARRLTSKKHRDYSEATDNEIAGSLDVLRFRPDLAIVDDWKTGRFVDHPGESVQQRGYALGGLILYNVPRVECGIVRVNAQQDPIRLVATFEADQLRAFAGELVQLRGKIRDKTQRPNPSALACRYCPIKKTCDVAYQEKKGQQAA